MIFPFLVYYTQSLRIFTVYHTINSNLIVQLQLNPVEFMTKAAKSLVKVLLSKIQDHFLLGWRNQMACSKFHL